MKKPPARKEQIADSLRRLAATYAQAISQLEETLGVLCRELDLQEITWSDVANACGSPAGREASSDRPVADRSTLSVLWKAARASWETRCCSGYSKSSRVNRAGIARMTNCSMRSGADPAPKRASVVS